MIGIAYSLKPVDRGKEISGPDDLFEEFDRPETIEAIADAIRAEGHDVSLMGDGREFLTKILASPPDFVFNFAEGEGAHRDREARIPAVCEMLGVPYSGSDPLTLAAALDKSIAKKLVRESRSFRIPFGRTFDHLWTDSQFANWMTNGHQQRLFDYPLIAKPAFEGSSKGIRGDCLAEDPKHALSILRKLSNDYQQPILFEEFIQGEELTVGLIGSKESTQVIGSMLVKPRTPTHRFVYSLEVKRDWTNLVDYESPPRIETSILENLHNAALEVHTDLGCRDVSRIDFRLRNGVPYFIEANPLPGLAPGTSDLVILAEGYGISHGELIRRILQTALTRVGLT